MTATVPEESGVTPISAKLPSPSILEKSVCVNVYFGFLGNSKKVKKSQISERGGILEDESAPVEVSADRDYIRVSKTLLDSEELRAIGHHDHKTKQSLRAICLPSLFRGGIYLVPIAAVEQVEAMLNEAAVKRGQLVNAFLDSVPSRRAQAQERLKDLFDPLDYPSIVKMRAKFEFEWQYVSFSTPNKLKAISAEFFANEQAKAAQKWQQATEEITLLLRTGLSELVDTLIAQLSPSEDGKKKRICQATVKNINEFLANLAIKNITDDAQLAALAEDAKKLLTGVDVKQLRKNDAAKTNLATGFTKIKEQLSLLVEEAGSRKIDLED